MNMTLAGFIALGALITGLFAWLRQDIRELRKDMDSKIGSLRNDLESKIDSGIDSLRSDLESKVDSLRKDLESKIGGLREELHKLSERVARIEGLLEAVFMRRDLTPRPEPPQSDDRPDKPRAA